MRSFFRKMLKRLSFLTCSGGMSLVNVIVAFVILMMLVAMMSKVVLLCQNMTVKADSVRKNTGELMGKYYTGDSTMDVRKLEDEDTVYKMTNGSTSFNFKTSVYSYTYGGITIYSFGQHSVSSAEGG